MKIKNIYYLLVVILSIAWILLKSMSVSAANITVNADGQLQSALIGTVDTIYIAG